MNGAPNKAVDASRPSPARSCSISAAAACPTAIPRAVFRSAGSPPIEAAEWSARAPEGEGFPVEPPGGRERPRAGVTAHGRGGGGCGARADAGSEQTSQSLHDPGSFVSRDGTVRPHPAPTLEGADPLRKLEIPTV